MMLTAEMIDAMTGAAYDEPAESGRMHKDALGCYKSFTWADALAGVLAEQLTEDLIAYVDGFASWTGDRSTEAVRELARRAGVDPSTYGDADDLWHAILEALGRDD